MNIWQPAFKQINQFQVVGLTSTSATTRRRSSAAPTTRSPTIFTSCMGRHNIDAGYHGEVVEDRHQQPLPAARAVHLQRQHHRRRHRELPVRVSLPIQPGVGPVLQYPRQVPGSLRSGQLESDAQSDPGLRRPLRAVHSVARNAGPHGQLLPDSLGVEHPFGQVSRWRLPAFSLPAIRDSIPMASPRPTTTSCPGSVSPRMYSATAKPASAVAPACSSTAASTARCSISTPTACSVRYSGEL